LLRQVVELIAPSAIVGVGVFAEERALKLALDVPVYRIPHPSPASPAANRGWSAMANSAFDALPL
jgi:single-strand selective monofunctional uracil DNA glycosylase